MARDPTADPSLGKWKASVFDLPGNDFTMLGYDQSGVYIGTNSEVAPSTPPPPERRSPQVVFIPRTAALAWPPQLDGTVTIVGPMHYVEYGDSLYPAIDGGPAA